MRKTIFMSIFAVALLASCAGSDTKKQTKEEDDERTEKRDKKNVRECQDSLVVMEFSEAAMVSNNGVVELTSVEQLTPNGKPVIIDFNAEWCVPCKEFAPHFEAVAEKMGDEATFISVDVDKWKDVASEYSTYAIPAVVIVKANGEKVSHTGYMELEDFEKFVSENL